MSRKYFGTDGIRAVPAANHAGLAQVRRRRAGVSARRLSPSRRYRQGYAAFRLHDRIRAGGRLHLGRHGRAAARPDTDAGGGDADQIDARRSGRDDFRLAQPVRGQRHQAVRAAGLQAFRRCREADRAAARGRSTTAGAGASLRRARASTRQTFTSIRQADAARISASTARVVVGAPGATYKWCQALQNSAPTSFHRGQPVDSSARVRLRRRKRWAQGAWCAPTSASRSTATPIGHLNDERRTSGRWRRLLAVSRKLEEMAGSPNGSGRHRDVDFRAGASRKPASAHPQIKTATVNRCWPRLSIGGGLRSHHFMDYTTGGRAALPNSRLFNFAARCRRSVTVSTRCRRS